MSRRSGDGGDVDPFGPRTSGGVAVLTLCPRAVVPRQKTRRRCAAPCGCRTDTRASDRRPFLDTVAGGKNGIERPRSPGSRGRNPRQRVRRGSTSSAASSRPCRCRRAQEALSTGNFAPVAGATACAAVARLCDDTVATPASSKVKSRVYSVRPALAAQRGGIQVPVSRPKSRLTCCAPRERQRTRRRDDAGESKKQHGLRGAVG